MKKKISTKITDLGGSKVKCKSAKVITSRTLQRRISRPLIMETYKSYGNASVLLDLYIAFTPKLCVGNISRIWN